MALRKGLMTEQLPVILSIPHGGVDVPKELFGCHRLNARDLFEDGDALTQELYDLGESVHAVIKAPIARAFVDLNRAPDSVKNRDGVVKTHTVGGKRIYKRGTLMTPDDIQCLLARYYYPYHDNLTRAAQAKNLHLALDCHSMLAQAPKGSTNPGEKRPLFCLSNRGGPDGYPDKDFPKLSCCPDRIQKLAECLRFTFELNTADVCINHPFHGGYITERHGLNPLPWIQVEINRKLYLNSPWFDPGNLSISPRRIIWLKKRFQAALEAYFKVL